MRGDAETEGGDEPDQGSAAAEAGAGAEGCSDIARRPDRAALGADGTGAAVAQSPVRIRAPYAGASRPAAIAFDKHGDGGFRVLPLALTQHMWHFSGNKIITK